MREQTEFRMKITSATLTPQEIEARIGLKPYESWKTGDRLGTFGAPARENGFVVESGVPTFAQFADCLGALLQKLAPSAQKIGALVPHAKIDVICTVRRKTAPALVFERDALRWLAVMGATLYVDTSVFSDEPRARAKGGSTLEISETPGFDADKASSEESSKL